MLERNSQMTQNTMGLLPAVTLDFDFIGAHLGGEWDFGQNATGLLNEW